MVNTKALKRKLHIACIDFTRVTVPVGEQPVVDYNVRCNPAGIRYFARWKNCKWRLPEHPCCPQKDKPTKIKKLSFKK